MASSRREFIKATAGALAAIPAGCSVLNAKTAEAPKAVVAYDGRSLRLIRRMRILTPIGRQ